MSIASRPRVPISTQIRTFFVSAAGDRVVDLTSLEGDWFFHDVFNMNNNALSIMELVRPTFQVLLAGNYYINTLHFLTIPSLLPSPRKQKQTTIKVYEVLKAVQNVINQIQVCCYLSTRFFISRFILLGFSLWRGYIYPECPVNASPIIFW